MPTNIEWTDETWNPWVGCSVISPGCTNCYAMRLAPRLEAMGQAAYSGVTRLVNGNRVWSGKVNRGSPRRFHAPLARQAPTLWFVNSMSDFFHGQASDQMRDEALEIMQACPQHRFQVLTKRPELMARFFAAGQGRRVPSNMWLGVSIESDRYVDRAHALRKIDAPVRFVSAEPLLGPLPSLCYGGLHWIIVGGESGVGARRIDPDWAREIRDARPTGTAFYMKQMSGFSKPLPPIPPDLFIREWPPVPDCMPGNPRESS